MAQINLYFKDGDTFPDSLRAAADELGLSSNELAIEILTAHLDEHAEMTRRLRLAREAELSRLTAEARVRDQRLLDEQVAGSARGAAYLLNMAWARARGLEIDVSGLGSPLIKDPHLAEGRLLEILTPILASSRGHLVSVEQLMAIALEVGGFSLPEAEALRKAGAKRQPDKIFEAGKRFLAGAAKRGISLEAAQFLYGRIMYGDPEAYAAFEKHLSEAAAPRVLYGVAPKTRLPILRSPWNQDGTVNITALTGYPGSGKSFWLRCQLTRQAALGTQLLVVDPLNDFGSWFARNGGQTVSVSADSPSHINPLRLSQNQVSDGAGNSRVGDEDLDVKIHQRLKPLFRLLLGSEYNEADGLIGHGLRAFYERYGAEEHVMADFLEVLRELNTRNEEQLPTGSIDERRRLIDNLKLKLVDGELRDFFAHKTNVPLDYPKLCFDLSRNRSGLPLAIAAYLAINAAADAAATSNERKLLVIDEVNRLFVATDSGAPAMRQIIEDVFRVHRHWNTAPMLATQVIRETGARKEQDELLMSVNTWILLRATELMLRHTLEQLNPEINPDDVLSYLTDDHGFVPGDQDQPRPAILVEGEHLTPFLSVSLGSEDELLSLK
jgi:hypothetical protein